MSGFDNEVVYGKNADFTSVDNQNVLEANGLATNGQLWIGTTAVNTGGTHINVGNLTSPLGTVTIGYSSPNITLDLSGGSTAVDSFSPDSGTDPVVPTGAGLVNVKGSGSITTVGSLNTITTQLTGLTNHALLVGAGTSTITKLAVGSNGQVLVGSTGADPVFATLTSSDSSISFTTGAGTLSLQVAGGTTSVKTLTGNSGGAISPTAGNINTLGTGSITIAGAGSTLTTQLTGLTANSVLYGLGTATIGLVASGTTGQVLQTNTAAAPTYSTATYPSTTTVSQILYSSATNTVTGLATANSATLVTTSTGVPVFSSTMTNGQVIIGSTGATPTAGTITSTGGTITVTTGAGTLNLEVASGGFAWTNVTSTSATMVKENAYQANNAGLVTLTMPSVASSTFGDTIKIAGFGAGGWLIQCVATQLIHMGAIATSAAGSIASTNRYDAIELVCSSTTTEWFARYSIGNLTIV